MPRGRGEDGVGGAAGHKSRKGIKKPGFPLVYFFSIFTFAPLNKTAWAEGLRISLVRWVSGLNQ